jgi:hypothetical protein
MNEAQHHIAIVNPFSSQKYVVDVLHNFNIKIAAVFTVNFLKHCSQGHAEFHPELYDHVFYEKEHDLAALSKKLSALKTEFILYGFEIDIDFADKLATIVCPNYANSPKTYLARADKHGTALALKEHGLLYTREFEIDANVNEEAIEKMLSECIFPVVFKPANFSGTMRHLQYLYSIQEAKEYISTLKTDPDTEDHRYIIQNKIITTEDTENVDVAYSIDSVSFGGKHYFISMQRWFKLKDQLKPRYYYAEQLLPTNPLWNLFAEETKKSLDAVGLKNGLAHPEFLLTKEGAVLLDLNPRCAGGNGAINLMMQASLNICPVTMLGYLITNTADQYIPATSYNYSYMVLFNKMSNEILEAARKLPSYFNNIDVPHANLYIVILSNADKNICEKDLSILLKYY